MELCVLQTIPLNIVSHWRASDENEMTMTLTQIFSGFFNTDPIIKLEVRWRTRTLKTRPPPPLFAAVVEASGFPSKHLIIMETFQRTEEEKQVDSMNGHLENKNRPTRSRSMVLGLRMRASESRRGEMETEEAQDQWRLVQKQFAWFFVLRSTMVCSCTMLTTIWVSSIFSWPQSRRPSSAAVACWRLSTFRMDNFKNDELKPRADWPEGLVQKRCVKMVKQ